ncbi:glycosyltransferase [Thermodesulfobacteriota bacterium]
MEAFENEQILQNWKPYQNMLLEKYTSGLVSILICSCNRRVALEALVTSLLEMETKHAFEIVVVEETDQPEAINGTIYVHHPVANLGIPYARNLALAHGKGEFIVFLDDDCHIFDRWLDMLLKPFKDRSLVGVQGGVTVPAETNAIGWAETILGVPGGGVRRLLESKGRIQETREISTLNCAYRASVLDWIGGFEKQLKFTGEDYLLAKQACMYGRCLFVPTAVVAHEARGSLHKIWHWFIRRGRAEVDVIRTGKQKDTTIWTVIRSSFGIKICLLISIGIFLFDWFILSILIGFLAYCLVQFVRYYKPWKSSGAKRNTFILIPLVKLTMDVAMDYGRLRGILFD